jgi:hypothetical protein
MDRKVGDTSIMLPVLDGGGGNTSSLNFPTRTILPEQPTSTSLALRTGIDATTTYVVQKINPTTKANIGSPITVVKQPQDDQVLTGLEEGATYSISVQASNGTSVGNKQILPPYTLSKVYASNGFSITNFNSNPKEIKSAKSYLELAYLGNNSKEYALAYKEFSGINFASSTQGSSIYLPPHIQDLIKAYNENYYTFGTSLFLENNSDKPNQSAGLAFFVSDFGKSAYIVLVESTSLSASKNKKSIRILKTSPHGGIQELNSTQRSNATTFDGVYGGRAYILDVKVKVLSDEITINVFVNGFKITAIDKNDFTNSDKLNFILAPTKNVGLVTFRGKSFFDYVYGTAIDKERYESKDYNPNFYQGQFSNDTIATAYGNLLYNANNADDENYKAKNIIEEFGSVVREIVRVKTKFDSRPTFPIKWSTGSNKYAKIIGQTLSSFGGEAYVLNNTSTTIPLSDGATASFYAFGNDIGQSGQLEYSTDESDSYNFKEPVIFKSSWLQNETDVKSLANWIKNKVVNRGAVIQMNVFGNPLLSVGDIVSVKYTYQGFNGTEKLIITSISHTYNQGLETSITCRTL